MPGAKRGDLAELLKARLVVRAHFRHTHDGALVQVPGYTRASEAAVEAERLRVSSHARADVGRGWAPVEVDLAPPGSDHDATIVSSFPVYRSMSVDELAALAGAGETGSWAAWTPTPGDVAQPGRYVVEVDAAGHQLRLPGLHERLDADPGERTTMPRSTLASVGALLVRFGDVTRVTAVAPSGSMSAVYPPDLAVELERARAAPHDPIQAAGAAYLAEHPPEPKQAPWVAPWKAVVDAVRILGAMVTGPTQELAKAEKRVVVHQHVRTTKAKLSLVRSHLRTEHGAAKPSRGLTILRTGLGRDSITMMLLLVERGLKVGDELVHPRDVDAVVFSDTGNEWPHTLEQIPKVAAFCQQHGLRFIVQRKPPEDARKAWVEHREVGSRERPPWQGEDGGTVEEKAASGWYHNRVTVLEDYESKSTIVARTDPSCTTNHKIAPNRKLLDDLSTEKFGIGNRAYGAEVRKGQRQPHRLLIGIAADEAQRADKAEKAGVGPTYEKDYYPLIAMGIGKDDEQAILDRHGFGNVLKSGCWHCKFQPKSWYWALAQVSPASFDKVVQYEAKALARNPKLSIFPDGPVADVVAKWATENPAATVGEVLRKDYKRAECPVEKITAQLGLFRAMKKGEQIGLFVKQVPVKAHTRTTEGGTIVQVAAHLAHHEVRPERTIGWREAAALDEKAGVGPVRIRVDEGAAPPPRDAAGEVYVPEAAAAATFLDSFPLYRGIDSREVDRLRAGGPDAAIEGGHFSTAEERSHGASWAADRDSIASWLKQWGGPGRNAGRLHGEGVILEIDAQGRKFGRLGLAGVNPEIVTPGVYEIPRNTANLGLGASVQARVRDVKRAWWIKADGTLAEVDVGELLGQRPDEATVARLHAEDDLDARLRIAFDAWQAAGDAEGDLYRARSSQPFPAPRNLVDAHLEAAKVKRERAADLYALMLKNGPLLKRRRYMPWVLGIQAERLARDLKKPEQAKVTLEKLLKAEQLGLFGRQGTVKAHVRVHGGKIEQVQSYTAERKHAQPRAPVPPSPPAPEEVAKYRAAASRLVDGEQTWAMWQTTTDLLRKAHTALSTWDVRAKRARRKRVDLIPQLAEVRKELAAVPPGPTEQVGGLLVLSEAETMRRKAIEVVDHAIKSRTELINYDRGGDFAAWMDSSVGHGLFHQWDHDNNEWVGGDRFFLAPKARREGGFTPADKTTALARQFACAAMLPSSHHELLARYKSTVRLCTWDTHGPGLGDERAGMAAGWSATISLFGWGYFVPDHAEKHATLVHEVGHLIDDFTGRRGPPGLVDPTWAMGDGLASAIKPEHRRDRHPNKHGIEWADKLSEWVAESYRYVYSDGDDLLTTLKRDEFDWDATRATFDRLVNRAVAVPLTKAQQLALFGGGSPTPTPTATGARKRVQVRAHVRVTRSGHVAQVKQHEQGHVVAAPQEDTRPEHTEYDAGRPETRWEKRSSKELLRWFGDWEHDPENASKVVDGYGKPQEQHGPLAGVPTPVYHGTAAGGFRMFDPRRDKGSNLFGRGFYFTEEKEIAESYTKKDEESAGQRAIGFASNLEPGKPVDKIPAISVVAMLKEAGYNWNPPPPDPLSGLVPLAPPGGWGSSPAWGWHPGATDRNTDHWRINGNFDSNTYYAVCKASDESGNVDVQRFLHYFWEPDQRDVDAQTAAAAGSYRGDKLRPIGDSNLDAAMYRIVRALGARGFKPIVPPAQVYEVYLNVRKPMIMESVASAEDIASLGAFIRARTIERAESAEARSAAKLAAARHESAHPEEAPAWKREYLAGDLEKAEQEHKWDLDGLEKRRADPHGWVYGDDVLPTVWDGTTGTRKVAIDHPGLDDHGQMIRVDHDTLRTLKRYWHDATDSKGEKVAMPLLHLTPRDTLTWQDVHYLAANLHRDAGFKQQFTDWAQSRGYDGMRHRGGWNVGTKDHTVWIAWSPKQIKATTSEHFDPTTDDLFKSTRLRFLVKAEQLGMFGGAHQSHVRAHIRPTSRGFVPVLGYLARRQRAASPTPPMLPKGDAEVQAIADRLIDGEQIVRVWTRLSAILEGVDRELREWDYEAANIEWTADNERPRLRPQAGTTNVWEPDPDAPKSWGRHERALNAIGQEIEALADKPDYAARGEVAGMEFLGVPETLRREAAEVVRRAVALRLDTIVRLLDDNKANAATREGPDHWSDYWSDGLAVRISEPFMVEGLPRYQYKGADCFGDERVGGFRLTPRVSGQLGSTSWTPEEGYRIITGGVNRKPTPDELVLLEHRKIEQSHARSGLAAMLRKVQRIPAEHQALLHKHGVTVKLFAASMGERQYGQVAAARANGPKDEISLYWNATDMPGGIVEKDVTLAHEVGHMVDFYCSTAIREYGYRHWAHVAPELGLPAVESSPDLAWENRPEEWFAEAYRYAYTNGDEMKTSLHHHEFDLAAFRAFIDESVQVDLTNRRLAKAEQLLLLPSKKTPSVKRWQRPYYDPLKGSVVMPKRLRHFASGSNRLSDLWALYSLGYPIGVVASEILGSDRSQKFIRSLQRRDTDVFVDSGAFSEVEFPVEGGPPQVVRPMTEEHWGKVLDLYHRIAVRLGEWAHVVAPDRIGDQDETLARLAKYRDRLLDIAQYDPEILVPIQRGKLSAAAFWAEAQRVLAFPRDKAYLLVPAVPMRKNATSAKDLAAFVAEAKPRRVHLLGIGPSKKTEDVLDAVEAAHPAIDISMDSNLIRGLVGTRKRPGALMRLKDELKAGDIPGEGGVAQRWALPMALFPGTRDQLRAVEARLGELAGGAAEVHQDEGRTLMVQASRLRDVLGPWTHLRKAVVDPRRIHQPLDRSRTDRSTDSPGLLMRLFRFVVSLAKGEQLGLFGARAPELVADRQRAAAAGRPGRLPAQKRHTQLVVRAHVRTTARGTALVKQHVRAAEVDVEPVKKAKPPKGREWTDERLAAKFGDIALSLGRRVQDEAGADYRDVNMTHRRSRMAANAAHHVQHLQALQAVAGGLRDLAEKHELPSPLRGVTSLALIENILTNEAHPGMVWTAYLWQRLSGRDGATVPEGPKRRLLAWAAANGGAVEETRGERVTMPFELHGDLVEAVKTGDGGRGLGWYIDETPKRIRSAHQAGLATPEEWAGAHEILRGMYDRAKDFVREPEDAKRLRELEQNAKWSKIPGYFPTPDPVLDTMFENAGDLAGKRVLEPSAGSGAIAARAKAAGAHVDAIEINSSLREILKLKGYDLVASDFLEYNPGPIYDAVTMNPPFEGGAEMTHVQHAFELLKPGGRVVSVMSPGPFHRQDRQATAFREWVERNGGSVEPLPEGSFKTSGTGVSTVLVVLDKDRA